MGDVPRRVGGSYSYLRAQPGSQGGGWVGWVWCMGYGLVSVRA